MRARDWFRPPHLLVTVFLATALASTSALAWLAWELIGRDRADARQRRDDDRERAADAAALALGRGLAALGRYLGGDSAFLPSPDGDLPTGAVAVTFRNGAFVTRPEGGLIYYPTLDAAASVDPSVKEARRLETAGRDLSRAARAWTAAAEHREPGVVASALTGLARVQRQQRAWQSALATYDRLEGLENVNVEGLPAGLVARLGRLSIFEEEQPDPARVRGEATRLKTDLERGRWPLSKAQYTLWAEEVRRWVGAGPAIDANAWTRADTFEWVWARRPEAAQARRDWQFVSIGNKIALVSWRATLDPEELAAVIVDPAGIRALASTAVPEGFAWALADLQGAIAGGDPPPPREVSVRMPTLSGIPGTLYVFRPLGTPASESPRRTLLTSVLVAVAVMLGAAWFFIWRGVSREARVARLQSDFIAAVSHEFRSPLTSLRHIADLLATDRLDGDRRRRSYALLVSETDRLGRLVEGLLDFGRLQNGRVPFKLEPVDLSTLTAEVVQDFSRRLDSASPHVGLASPASGARAVADREAIGRVLWNLLDNAVKYSPEGARVDVSVSDLPKGQVAVSVYDQGFGIPPVEQERIFDRFVRGAEAKARRIRGTGIGLAMAREIVRAHGGDITVTSEPGRGSTFTVVLPAASW